MNIINKLWPLSLVLFIAGFFVFSVPQASAASISLTADSEKITAGEEVRLTMDIVGTGTLSCELQYASPSGSWTRLMSFTGSQGINQVFKESLSRTRTYRFSCTEPNGTLYSDTVTVVVINPLTVGLYPHPSIAAPNDSSAYLQYYVNDGWWPISCQATGPNLSRTIAVTSTSTASGTIAVAPSSTSTYTLSCTDSQGTVESDEATMTVSSAPIVTIKASTDSLPTSGGTVDITASTYLRTTCQPTGGTASWRGLGTTAPVYALSNVNLTQTTTFSLECFNAAGQSSGKESVTVYVGVSPLCGNGVVDRELGEHCDEGAQNSNTCPAFCSTTCQQNGCDSVAKITLTARPSSFNLGDKVKISWSTTDAVSCEVSKGEGWSNPIGTSGSVDVYPKRTQNYDIECYDAGGKSTRERVTVYPKEEQADVEILSFTAVPPVVPFNSPPSTPIKLQWTLSATPNSSVDPSCLVGNWTTQGFRPIEGFPFKSEYYVTGTTASKVITVDQLKTNSQSGPPGTKRVELSCKYQGEESYQSLNVYFESDPSQRPVVGLALATGPSNNRTATEITLDAGKKFILYQLIRGAERCEFTNHTGATKPLTPFVGEKIVNYAVGVQQTTVFTLECWNGDLSSKAEATVIVPGSLPADNPGLPGSCPGRCVRIDEGCGTGETQGPANTCSGLMCCVPASGTGGTGSGTGGNSGGVPITRSTLGALLNFQNPLAFTTVPALVTTLLTALQNIIVTLALIFIIIGAFLYLTSAGNEGRMETGKKAILAALIGLALGIAAPAFLKEIAAVLGWTDYTPLTGVGTSLSLYEILFKVLSFLLTIIGIITIIMLVIGGMLYLTAAGNEDQIDKGKKIVKYSIIGITIALAALVLVKQVAKFFVG